MSKNTKKNYDDDDDKKKVCILTSAPSARVITSPTANLDREDDIIEAGKDVCFIFEWLASYLTSKSFVNEIR